MANNPKFQQQGTLRHELEKANPYVLTAEFDALKKI